MSDSLTFNHEDRGTGAEDLMSAALMVEGGDNEEEDGRPPMDGMAYLRQVSDHNTGLLLVEIMLCDHNTNI